MTSLKTLLAVAGVSAFLLVGCSSTNKAQSQQSLVNVPTGSCPAGLEIGYLAPLTGPNAPRGEGGIRGAQFAIDRFNAANADCTVALHTFDTAGDPAQAVRAAEDALADSHIVGVVGPIFSGTALSALPVLDAGSMPMLTVASNPALARGGWKVFHRIGGNDDLQGDAAARYMSTTLGASNIAVVDDGTVFGKGLADIVRQQLGAKATMSAVVTSDSDATSVVSSLKGADAIYFGGYSTPAASLVKALRASGSTAPFVVSDGANGSDFISSAGSAAEGVVATCLCQPVNDTEAGRAFAALFETAYPGIDPDLDYAVQTFDATNVLLSAIANGKTTRQEIQSFLSSTSWNGVSKNIRFESNGESPDNLVYASKVTNGAYVVIGRVQ